MQFFVFTSFLLMFLALPGMAGAGSTPLPGTACESDFWKVLDARAKIEGKYDLEIAQKLIEPGLDTRPDSILDITRFECRMVEVHDAVNYIFSDRLTQPLFSNRSFMKRDDHEPTILGGPHSYSAVTGNYPSVGYSVLGVQRMDNTLIRLIRSGLKNYFMPTFYAPFSLQQPPATVCQNMFEIWNAAKCNNIDRNLFKSRSQIASCGGDPRGCEICPPGWKNPLRPSWWYLYQLGIGVYPPGYGTVMHDDYGTTFPIMDKVDTFFSLLNPGCNPNGNPPSIAIPTGVIADLKGIVATHPDAICSNPGCWYDPTDGRCKP